MSEKTTVGQTSNRKQASSTQQSQIEQLSWEYLMPKKKERMAGYIRESDPTLLDSATIDSQAKAVREYAQREGYLYDIARHEYREAISAYTVSYMERPTLLKTLAAAKRHEFDVFVVTEIRALSRRQVEVFVIYDILQKYGVRLETIQEKFEDSAIGRYILATRAMIAEVERENTYARMQRGKKDRLENGNLNGHPKPAYGYIFLDTAREVKARYDLNTKVIYIGSDGTQWTEVKVIIWMFDRALEGWSIRRIALTLTDMGIPNPHHNKIVKGKPVSNHWRPSTVYTILTNPLYTGAAFANKYKNVGKTKVKRPQQEQVLLPHGIAPAIISQEVFDNVQLQLEINKQDALRNNHHSKDLGILRSGYCRCGICNGSMTVRYHPDNDRRKPEYFCQVKTGKEGLLHNHITTITLHNLDQAAWKKAVEVIRDPNQVREKIALYRERRKREKPVVSVEDVQVTIDNIQAEIDNLFDLARYSTNEANRKRLGLMMENLEKRQREAETMLIDIDEDEEEQEKLEEEIAKFEKWADDVRPQLDNPSYVPTYEFQRLAVRIIGLHAIVYPLHGDYPFRRIVEASPPKIMKHLPAYCVRDDQSYTSCGQTECSTGKSGETL